MSFMTISSDQAVKRWYETSWVRKKNENLLINFIGDSEDAIIHRNTELKGDQEHGYSAGFDVLEDITHYGVSGDNLVYGTESYMTLHHETVQLGKMGAAVKYGRWEEKITMKNLKKSRFRVLMNWAANQKTDWMYKELTGQTFQVATDGTVGTLATFTEAGVTNTYIIYPNSNYSGTGQINPEDKINVDMIDRAANAARTGILAGSTIKKMHPGADKNGVVAPVLILHTWVARDLLKDPDYRDVNRAAFTGKGELMPEYKGAVELPPWNGVRIFQTDMIPRSTTWGPDSITSGFTNLMLFQQAAVYAEDIELDWAKKALGYRGERTGDPEGLAVFMQMGFRKVQFNSCDHGVMVLKCAAKEAA